MCVCEAVGQIAAENDLLIDSAETVQIQQTQWQDLNISQAIFWQDLIRLISAW